MSADMSPFMCENRGIVSLIIATREYDILHPTEWRHVTRSHADHGTISLLMLLATLDKQPHPHYAHDRIAQCDYHSDEEGSNGGHLPERHRGIVHELCAQITDGHITLGVVDHHRLVNGDDTQR